MLISFPLRFTFFLVLFLPSVFAVAATPPLPAQPDGYVVDLAHVLDDSTKKQLDDLLRALEQQTTAQLVVLTVDSLDGQDINSFSLQTAEQWKIGQKDKDNGLLFVVSIQDRKYRFEVGYGLESILPDGKVGSIGRKILVPYFKEGQYGPGITAVVGSLLEVMTNHYGIHLSGVDELPVAKTDTESSALSALIFFLFILVLFYSRSVNKKMRGTGRSGLGGYGTGPVILPGGGWGRGSSGGFGGFSGGGGGFGGGGASGGW